MVRSPRGKPRISILVWAAALAIAVVWAPLAHADKVDDLIQQLHDSDYKVRLSATINLGKLGDKRAVPGLTDALSDSDKTVRGVAAAALGKLVDASVGADERNHALDELERVAKSDGDGFVRGQAQKSFDALKSLRGGTAPATGKGVLVEVGPMADSTKQGGPPMLAAMRKSVVDTLGKKAPAYQVSTGNASVQAGSAPTAFYVDGTLTTLTVKGSHVACNVSMILATYPQKSMFGFLKGGAEVDAGSSSPKAIADATSDCVTAVVEDLVERQVVPTIRARAGK